MVVGKDLPFGIQDSRHIVHDLPVMDILNCVKYSIIILKPWINAMSKHTHLFLYPRNGRSGKDKDWSHREWAVLGSYMVIVTI